MPIWDLVALQHYGWLEIAILLISVLLMVFFGLHFENQLKCIFHQFISHVQLKKIIILNNICTVQVFLCKMDIFSKTIISAEICNLYYIVLKQDYCWPIKYYIGNLCVCLLIENFCILYIFERAINRTKHWTIRKLKNFYKYYFLLLL